ncbi:transmembrane protein 134 isoform X4 [Phyllostomus discolor]|uniref:Transmembrane protein 134 isoform X4 n=1 Tax=Phyllostomus discolor TaxID=89673 RepID=A0A7E6E292_9CHIR|nr:transmembrane protein 134 isoform X4 [Phyllostomus discolor]
MLLLLLPARLRCPCACSRPRAASSSCRSLGSSLQGFVSSSREGPRGQGLHLPPHSQYQVLHKCLLIGGQVPPRSSADCGRRGTGGGPLTRCLQRHLLRARLPVAGPRSLPRDLHLLCGQGPPGFPVLLPALLREVSPLQTPIDHRPQGSAWAPGSLLSSPGGAPRPARATPVPSSRWKSPFCRTPGAPAPSRVSSGSLGRTLSLGPGKSPLARSVP